MYILFRTWSVKERSQSQSFSSSSSLSTKSVRGATTFSSPSKSNTRRNVQNPRHAIAFCKLIKRVPTAVLLGYHSLKQWNDKIIHWLESTTWNPSRPHPCFTCVHTWFEAGEGVTMLLAPQQPIKLSFHKTLPARLPSSRLQKRE